MTGVEPGMRQVLIAGRNRLKKGKCDGDFAWLELYGCGKTFVLADDLSPVSNDLRIRRAIEGL